MFAKLKETVHTLEHTMETVGEGMYCNHSSFKDMEFMMDRYEQYIWKTLLSLVSKVSRKKLARTSNKSVTLTDEVGLAVSKKILILCMELVGCR